VSDSRVAAAGLITAAIGWPPPTLPDDELGRLAERQEELAAGLTRRDGQVARAVEAITAWAPADGAPRLLEQATRDARDALGLTDARIVLGDRDAVEYEERVPGEPQPVRAEVRTGREIAGVLVGHAPATTRWEPADQDLLELFAASLAVALRDAELLARVESQNARLVELDAEKDDFLRGVSHNLQTPLARIRAYADQLAGEQGTAGEEDAGGTSDRRPAIIAEQADRLSRMVRQLLTVSRLDSGVLHPVAEVFALGPRVRRAWEALGAGGVPFEMADEAGGWLAVADPDQVDSDLGVLDNPSSTEAVRASGPPGGDRGRGVAVTVPNGGPGVAEADREHSSPVPRGGRWRTGRHGPGPEWPAPRRANGGDLELEPARPGAGATFSSACGGAATEG